MSQVFLSYASADRDRAKRLADAMQRRGYRVWWDRQIVPGQTFDEVIEHALDESACVVVLWSSTSIKSQWVKTEAAEAASRRILVPVRIDDVKIPLEFRRLQAADLIQWNGDSESPEFLHFLGAVDREILEHREALSEAPTQLGGSVAALATPPRPLASSQAVVDRVPVPPDLAPVPPSASQGRPEGRPLRRTWIVASLSVVTLAGAAIVWVIFGRGPQVPDVVGMSYEQGAAALTAAGLSPERREQPSSTDTPGRIVAQSQLAGVVLARGSTVSLTVAVAMPPAASAANPGATGEPPAADETPVVTLKTIPDLRGQTVEGATALLAAQELRIGATIEVASNTAPLGTIVEQEPVASQTVANGAQVRITVATRRNTPDLAGLNLQQAQEELTKLGLGHRLERVRAGRREPDSRVVTQSPAAGSEIGAGGEVSVTVAIVTPKQVDGGEPPLFRTGATKRCPKVCQDIGLKWTSGWDGTANTCTCDF